MALYPDNVEIMMDLAGAYESAGMHDRAEALYRLALTMDACFGRFLDFLKGAGDTLRGRFAADLASVSFSRHNGRRLYIADAIEGREYSYDLSPGAADRRIGLAEAERSVNRGIVRRQIADLAAWYGFTP